MLFYRNALTFPHVWFSAMEKNEKKKNIIGKALLFSATLVWGSSFVILKDTLTELGNGNFTFFILAARFLIASLIFVLFSVKRFSALNKKIVLHGAVLGTVLFMAYAVQTVALNYTTPSKNAFLTETYCILVPFLSWLFFKKHPSKKNFAAAIMCLCGVLLIAFFGKTEKASNEILGDGLTIFSGLFYALQIIFISQYSVDDDTLLLLTFEILTAAVLCALTSLVWEFPRHGAEFSLSAEAVWKILYLAVIATGFAQFAQMYGQKFTSATTTSIIMCFEGVFGVMFEFIFGQNNLNGFIIAGFSIILITLIFNETDFDSVKRAIEKRKNGRKIREGNGETGDYETKEDTKR